MRNLDLDASDLVLRPLALTVALILCTPVSWRRRLAALFWCVLWEHVVVLFAVAFFIWNESNQLSPDPSGSWPRQVAGDFQQMLVNQLDLGVPLVLWIAVVFRRGDEGLRLPAFPGAKTVRPEC